MIKISKPYLNKKLAITVVGIDLVFGIVLYSINNYITGSSSNFRFEFYDVLYGLILLPVLSLLFIYHSYWKNKAIDQFGDEAVIAKIVDTGKTEYALVKHLLQKFALLFLLIALANPQYGKAKKDVTANGIDIMIGLDVSNSMMAEDVAGNFQRLKMAKLALEKLIYNLKGDRIGIVVFAANAYKQLPITNDYEMALMYLSGVNPGMLSNQGTAIGKAIDSCMTAFKLTEPSNKTIIIISDGENHEDDAIIAAKNAYEKGVIVNTIGIGSIEGSTIPAYENNDRNGVKRDEDGNPVITKMSPELMQNIANAGGGTYKYGEGADLGLNDILKSISNIEKKKTKSNYFTEFEDRFQLYLLIGLALLLLDHLIINKKQSWLGQNI